MARFPFNLSFKASRARALLYLTRIGQAVWSGRDKATLAREGYERNPIAYRCIRLVAESVADLPWIVRVGDKVQDEHPLLELLENPNPEQTGMELVEHTLAWLQIAGDAYIEGVTLNDELRELYPLRPDRMKLVPGRNGQAAAYEFSTGGRNATFNMPQNLTDQAPILHMRMFHPTNDSYGLSSVEPAAYSIDIHNSAGSYNKSLLDNQARPSGALIYKGKEGAENLTDDQFDRLKLELKEVYEGVENAGRPLVLDGGLDWKDMGMNLRDLDFVEGKRESAREIALAFGVPPMLLGIPGDNTYSNYAEANRAFHRQTVLPLGRKYGACITRFVRPSFEDRPVVTFDPDQIHALVQEREALWKKVGGADWITYDEARAATGYEALPDKEKGGELKKASQRGQGDRGEDDGDRKPADAGDPSGD